MIDVNKSLKKTWNDALTAVGLNVYFNQAPDEVKDAVYVVMDLPSATNRDTMNSQDITQQVRLTVRGFSFKYNDGEAVQTVVNTILTTIKPAVNSTLVSGSTGYKIVSTKLVSNTEQGYTILNTRNYLDRILLFEHHIHFN